MDISTLWRNLKRGIWRPPFKTGDELARLELLDEVISDILRHYRLLQKKAGFSLPLKIDREYLLALKNDDELLLFAASSACEKRIFCETLDYENLLLAAYKNRSSTMFHGGYGPC